MRAGNWVIIAISLAGSATKLSKRGPRNADMDIWRAAQLLIKRRDDAE
jgi:hypothetical protein